MKKVLIALLACGSGSVGAHRIALSIPRPIPQSLEETLPSENALRLTSLSYATVVADYYWLRALSHFGDSAAHGAQYPNLAPFVRRIVSLDPKFAKAYFFAGAVLTLTGMPYKDSVTLLEQGMKERPDDWRIAYLAGFNAYHFLGDFQRGARYLAVAAKHPNAPPITGALAMRVAAHGGEPELGLQILDQMLELVKNESSQKALEGRRKQLLTELHLRWLNQAAQRYQQQTGEAPTTVDQLVGPDLLREIPPHPNSGTYFMDTNGTVTTDSERLLLPPSALHHSSPSEMEQ